MRAYQFGFFPDVQGDAFERQGKKACPEVQEGVGEAEEPGEPPALQEEDSQEAERLREEYG